MMPEWLLEEEIADRERRVKRLEEEMRGSIDEVLEYQAVEYMRVLGEAIWLRSQRPAETHEDAL